MMINFDCSSVNMASSDLNPIEWVQYSELYCYPFPFCILYFTFQFVLMTKIQDIFLEIQKFDKIMLLLIWLNDKR